MCRYWPRWGDAIHWLSRSRTLEISFGLLRGSTISGLLVHLAQVLNRAGIDLFGHAVKIYQETQEDLIASGAVFVDAIEITQYRDAGDVLAMKGQDAVGLRTHGAVAVGSRHLSMQMLMLHIVGGGNLGEKASNHLDDVLYGHAADFILRSLVPALVSKALAIV